MNLKDYLLEYVSSGRGNRGTPSVVTVDSLIEMDMENFIRVLDDLTSGSMALDERAYDIDLERAYELISTIHRNDMRLHYAIADSGAGIPELWIFSRTGEQVYRMMFRNGNSLQWIKVYNLYVSKKTLVHYREYTHSSIDDGVRTILRWLETDSYIDKPIMESYSDDRKNYLFKCLDKTSDYGFDVTLYTCPELEDYYSLSKVSIGRELKLHPEYVCVFLVEVNEGDQYTGNGTNFMSDLCEWADNNGKTMTLTPSDDFGATSVSRLIKFYKRFGFVENKGKHTDFTTKQNMYRKPR